MTAISVRFCWFLFDFSPIVYWYVLRVDYAWVVAV